MLAVCLVVAGAEFSTRRGSSSSSSRGPSHPLDIFHILPVILVHPHLLKMIPNNPARNTNRKNKPQWKVSPEGGLVVVKGNVAFTVTPSEWDCTITGRVLIGCSMGIGVTVITPGNASRVSKDSRTPVLWEVTTGGCLMTFGNGGITGFPDMKIDA